MKGILHVFALALVATAEVLDYGRLTEQYKQNISLADITFTLYNNKNGNNGVKILFGNKESIAKAGFNPRLPVKVATHGYMSNGECFAVQNLRRVFLGKGDCNFISVDWSKYAKNVLYEEAALAAKPIGHHVSNFLKFLWDETKFNITNTHALGHSLGAHVVSHVSKEFQKEKIGRISGLDPAAPMFETLPPAERLDPEDAQFVDVTHTSTFFLGVKKPIGTVDFYPNGGNRGQPGCDAIDFECQHHMSHRYFAHTVKYDNYKGVKCDSLADAENGACNGEIAPMGIGAINAKPGIYYAKITEAPVAC